jgi:hypothetical protein
MIKLEFPEPDFKTRKEGKNLLVFDRIRSLWVTLQPEEWVRQNLINWLIKVQKIPSAFISVERSLVTNSLNRRCDILIYDMNHLPWMMVEVKAQGVELNASVLSQVLNYHMGVPVKFVLITNGDLCFIASLDSNTSQWLTEFPEFE